MDNPNVSQVNINIDSRIGATPYLDYIITFTYNTYRLEQDANGNMVSMRINIFLFLIIIYYVLRFLY